MKAATLHWYRTRSDASPLGFELRADHRGRTWRMYRLADSKWRVRPTDRPQSEATFKTPEEARRWASEQAAMNPRKERYARNPQRRTDRKATFRRGQKVALRRPIQPAAAGSVFTVAEVDTKHWKIPRYRLPVGWVSQKDLVAVPQKNPKNLTGDEAYQAQELRLFIDRDQESKAQRAKIEAKLNDDLSMNRYDSDVAQDAFDPLVKDAARRAGLGKINARVRNYVAEELAYDLQWEYDAAGRLELATYHEFARPYHNPEMTTMARQIKNPQRDKSFYRRNLIIDPDLVERASHWHGGQGTALYSFTSTASHDYVSPSMIQSAIGDLEYSKSKLSRHNRSRKELDEIIGELDAIMNFPSEFSTKEAGLGDVDAGYDEQAMRDDGFQGNPRGSTEVDDVAARELELYIDNDEPLYRMWQAIVRNMWKHTKRGRFDAEKAVVGFMHLADAGAKKYAKEFGSRGDKWFEMFDVPTRTAVAKEYAKSFEQNDRDESHYMPEGMRHNPESDVFREFATPHGTEVLWLQASEAYVLVPDEGALLSREILVAAATADELDVALREYNPRKQNPSRKKNGAGLGALIGSTIGAVLGFGFSSIPLAGLGSLVGGTVGGYVGAPKDRKKRGAAGGAIGGAILGPIGAGVGGYIGGRKPDRDYGRRNNPEQNPPLRRARGGDPRRMFYVVEHSDGRWTVHEDSPTNTALLVKTSYEDAEQALVEAEGGHITVEIVSLNPSSCGCSHRSASISRRIANP